MLNCRHTFTFAAILIGMGASNLFAQEQAGGTPPAHKSKKTPTVTVLLPEFYQHKTRLAGDTTYKYECSGPYDKQLNVNNIKSPNEIKDVYYEKCYFQSPGKPGAIVSPPYLSRKLYTWERTSDNTWIGIDRLTTYKVGFKENRGQIVRTESESIVNPLTNETTNVIRKYYKVQKVDFEEVPHGHEH